MFKHERFSNVGMSSGHVLIFYYVQIAVKKGDAIYHVIDVQANASEQNRIEQKLWPWKVIKQRLH